jgi:hypothetical protein
MPWQQPSASQDLSTEALTANILCERHNNALSPLDSEAELLFRNLTEIFSHQHARSLSTKDTYCLVSGDNIELWMLKSACGLYYSVASDQRTKPSATLSINLEKVHSALFKHKWDAGAGLYLNATIGDTALISGNHAGFIPLGIETRFAGIRVSFHGLELDLIFDAETLNGSAGVGKVFRPGELMFTTGKRLDSVIFTWANEIHLKSVRMKRRPVHPQSS